MLPIRFACFRLTVRLLCLLLLPLVLGVADPSTGAARPLERMGVEDFRTLIARKRDPDPEVSTAGPVLADYRRKLRQAAKDLPSLGEVTRVLLLSEWASAEDVIPSPAPSDQVRKAVSQASDDAFKSAVRKLLAAYPVERNFVKEAIVAEIKREVHLQLLDRLEKRLRFYLLEGRTEDRIAAANLVSDTMMNSRRQDTSQLSGVPNVMFNKSKEDITPSSKYLRPRLRALSGDLQKLIADSNPQVQVAAIRALSDLEREPGNLVVLVKPLLTSPQASALTRQAAAEALGHVLEVSTAQMDRSRPAPYLRSVQQVLPAVAEGLTDSDARVRRASLEACQRAALILNELASDPLAASDRLIVFRPTLAVVEEILIKLNASARDRVPELRVGACRVLETLALTIQKLKRQNEQYLPQPPSEPSNPEMAPNKERDKNKSLSPPIRGGRQASARRSPRWATVRAEQPSLMPILLPASLVPVSSGENAAPDVALQRPIKLPEERVIQAQGTDAPRSVDAQPLLRTAFQPQQNDELPQPLPVDPAIQTTVKTMIANMKHPDYRVRLAAVDTLETFGARAEAAIPALVAGLKDYNKFVRWAAARTLGRLHPRRPEEVVPGLMAMLDDREDPSVRITAAYSLELYGEHAKKAVPLLARVINRGDKEYIVAILHTIQGIGTDAAPALPNVAWILRDRAQPLSVRIEAAQTLGNFGTLAKEQIPVLRDIMINDPDEAMRNAASAAILAIDRPQ
ncbi:MAG: HEAT repeat domain-containing protein [Gemmataceae bacterium]